MTDDTASRIKDMIECMKSSDIDGKACKSYAEKVQQYSKQTSTNDKVNDPELKFVQGLEKRNSSDPSRIMK